MHEALEGIPPKGLILRRLEVSNLLKRIMLGESLPYHNTYLFVSERCHREGNGRFAALLPLGLGRPTGHTHTSQDFTSFFLGLQVQLRDECSMEIEFMKTPSLPSVFEGSLHVEHKGIAIQTVWEEAPLLSLTVQIVSAELPRIFKAMRAYTTWQVGAATKKQKRLASWPSSVPIRGEGITHRAQCWCLETNRNDFCNLHSTSEFGLLDVGFTNAIDYIGQRFQKAEPSEPLRCPWEWMAPGMDSTTSEVSFLLKAPKSLYWFPRAATTKHANSVA